MFYQKSGKSLSQTDGAGLRSSQNPPETSDGTNSIVPPVDASEIAENSMRDSAENSRLERHDKNNNIEKTAKKEKITAVNRFSAKRLATMALFAALSYAISFLEFPIFPAATWLQLDFGNVFIMLIGFLLGPVEGVIVCVVKESLRLFSSKSGGVGELANIAITLSYILIPALVYRFRKGLPAVIPSLAAGCVLATCAGLLLNRFLLLGIYGIADPASFFKDTWGFILAFNLIKTAAISLLTMIVYKRLSSVLKFLKI